MEMSAVVGLVTAFVLAGVVALGLQLLPDSRVEAELCWSCGARDGHKLWCPNR